METICLYEREPERLLPLTWTRPVWDLRAGRHTLAERVAAASGGLALSHAGREHLDPWWRERGGRSLCEPLPLRNTLFLDAGLALDRAGLAGIAALAPPFRLRAGDAIVGYAPGASAADAPVPGGPALPELLDRAGREWPVHDLEQPLIRDLPDLIRHLERLIVTDAELDDIGPFDAARFPGVTVLGDHRVRVAPEAVIDPGTTLDARSGPITIGSEARVSFRTWLSGPASIGSGSRLLGGSIGPLIGIGPVCRIRGEIAESLVHGYTNKAHDGFIGHSVLGEWVNLGALTTCSDLKNNYSEVRLELDGRTVASGLDKLGVFIADHAKTAIGTLLSTGTVVGVGANVFGEPGLSPKHVPSFAWGTHGAARSYALDRFLVTARRTFDRRVVEWTPATEDLLRRIYDAC